MARSGEAPEVFSCLLLCKSKGWRRSLEKQVSNRCILPGMRLSLWTDPNEGLAVTLMPMGAPPDYDREGERDHPITGPWHEPREDIEHEGCPGAWYRTDWIESVRRYYRRRDDQGNRVSNPALDRCDDHLVHEAVLELEHHEDAWRAEYSEAHTKLLEQERNK